MTRLDVVGMGNALVDVLAAADDAFLTDNHLVKGAMTLVDAERSASLYAAMGPTVEASGGSAANTMAGIASLGGRAGFLGRVRDDQLGAVFAHDIRAVGVEFPNRPASTGAATGRCLILVTPDAQRTMNTYLGAASELGPEDVDDSLVEAAAVTYLEGYLFDRDTSAEAFEKASVVCHGVGGRVALNLSDSFCVDRFREEFRDLVDGAVDILFANAEELGSLYEATPDEALAEAERRCSIVVMTRGPIGSTVSVVGERSEVPAVPATVVDTTGAGDLYAAGFLVGLTSGRDPVTCGLIGSTAASEVISHVGARPQTVLAELAAPLLA